jgi:hypothetical protein
MALMTPPLKVLAAEEPALDSGEPPGSGRLLLPSDRPRENRALCAHARTLLGASAVLAFRCECDQPLCQEAIVLTLGEYEAGTSGLRAVVVPGHDETDARDVVERTSRFCVVEEPSIAV